MSNDARPRTLMILGCLGILAATLPAAADNHIGKRQDPLSVPEYRRAFESGWRICNLSKLDPVNVAVRYWQDGSFVTRGWYLIAHENCVVIQSRLTGRYAYFHAYGRTPERRKLVWAGSVNRCINPRSRFSAQGDDCGAGMEMAGFREVDFKERSGYTTTLNPARN